MLPEWQFLPLLQKKGIKQPTVSRLPKKQDAILGHCAMHPRQPPSGKCVLDRVELLDEHVAILFRRLFRRLSARGGVVLSARRSTTRSKQPCPPYIVRFNRTITFTPSFPLRYTSRLRRWGLIFSTPRPFWRNIPSVAPRPRRRRRHPRGRRRAIHVRPRRRHGRTRRDLRAQFLRRKTGDL